MDTALIEYPAAPMRALTTYPPAPHPAPAGRPGPYPEARRCPGGDDGRCHVLVVDDAREILAVVRDLLEDEGYRVSTMDRRFDEAATVRAIDPDVIILDYIWADGAAGLEMLDTLRADRATAGIPVIICTGAKRQVGELGDARADDNLAVLLKPFDIDDMLDAVEVALDGGAPVRAVG